MIDFSLIQVGKEYSRKTLAEMWGYESIDAIRRGVITPRGKDLIVFFVTREKSQLMTKYEDHIDHDILFWEGENAHGSDQRIIQKKDFIHVFYRERERTNFTYQGRADLKTYKLFDDRPSKFSFQLIDKIVSMESLVEEVKQSYGLPATEKEAIIKSRIGQGVYRENAIKLWGTCSVTGFTKADILIASHIKPWKVSSNEERLTPYNSLLLVPTLDKLFDKGFIGFQSNGKIQLSSSVGTEDWNRIGLNTETRLRNVPNDVKTYLNYHSEYVFDLISH